MKPYYEHAGITIYHGDCLDVLPLLSDVPLVIADPPYNGVLSDEWDNKWSNDDQFLEWLDGPIGLAASALADNGTLYVWCWPTLSARVESIVAKHARPIASVVWDKGDSRYGAAGSGIDVTALRTYWPANSERCVVAEKRPVRYELADQAAKDASGYWDACQQAKRSVIGDYLNAEFRRAGVTNKAIAALFPSRTGGMTGCVSNWLLGHNIPTAEQYEVMRAFLNCDCRDDYLRREYDYLRREYDDLRREYDDLRRPFYLRTIHQWGDVWRFRQPSQRFHPAEKPIDMIGQIIEVSSRTSDIVVDPFMGSGTSLRAAKNLGRRAIGIEIEERYCEIAARRLSQEVLPFAEAAP